MAGVAPLSHENRRTIAWSATIRFRKGETYGETPPLFVALTFVLPVILAPVFVEAQPVISAPSVTVGVGDLFTIPTSISGAVDLTSWQLDFAFDPTLVTAISVTEGPFMLTFGGTLFIPGVIDNGPGLISLVADSYVDIPPNPSGDGVLANIQFRALAPGVSPLTFSNVFLNLSGQGFDVVNGQITVTAFQQAVPSLNWTALALLAIGLTFLGIRRLVRRGRRDEF